MDAITFAISERNRRMTIYHKHIVFLSPNGVQAQAYAEQIRAILERCKITDTTIGISVEWDEVSVVTDTEEGADE